MRVLITGITGFFGSHLADYILASHPDVEIHGLKRWRSRMDNIIHLQDKISLHEGDMKDIVSLRRCLAEVKPDRIFHLAAQSYVPASWISPNETLAINALGQINLFEALISLKLSPKIQITGTSEEYGQVHPEEIPVKETNPLRPLSPYAVSKVAQDLLGFQYFKSYGLRTVRTRGFNQTGPRRSEVFVCSGFAKQIVEIEKGKKEPVIFVGNLKAQRDFTDVRDTVQSFWLCLEKGEEGEVYNIGSGKAYSMKEILDTLLQLSNIDVKIKVDSQRLRPSDVPILVADCTKFNTLTGWKPKIPLKQSLQDLLDFWRDRV
jgi:GDP-4-dehydro-6-deoxy-D-mannose reductase